MINSYEKYSQLAGKIPKNREGISKKLYGK